MKSHLTMESDPVEVDEEEVDILVASIVRCILVALEVRERLMPNIYF